MHVGNVVGEAPRQAVGLVTAGVVSSVAKTAQSVKLLWRVTSVKRKGLQAVRKETGNLLRNV